MMLLHKATRTRLLRVTVIMGAAAGSMILGVAPASAHGARISTHMDTDGVGVLVEGGNRTMLSGHNHDVTWGFTSFPSGGSINVRIRFLRRPSDGDCSREGLPIVSDGALRVYTGTGSKTLATDILPGTCYRLIWRPNNSATAHKILPGVLGIGDS